MSHRLGFLVWKMFLLVAKTWFCKLMEPKILLLVLINYTFWEQTNLSNYSTFLPQLEVRTTPYWQSSQYYPHIHVLTPVISFTGMLLQEFCLESILLLRRFYLIHIVWLLVLLLAYWSLSLFTFYSHIAERPESLKQYCDPVVGEILQTERRKISRELKVTKI